jgi:CspA family cold shock protein
VPTGKVKWYDAKRGFGFVASDDGGEVFLPSSSLPAGVLTLRPGARIEFGVASGRRGDQALAVRLLDPLPSLAKAQRRPPEELATLIEDLIRVLDHVGAPLRKGHYPAPDPASKAAKLLRAVADQLDA